MFLYYVTRQKEQGLQSPDFNAGKDGYRKQWLWIGLEEYSDKLPSHDVRQYFDEIKDLLGTTVNFCSKETGAGTYTKTEKN